VALVLGLNFDQGPLQANIESRITTLTNEPLFKCPDNDVYIASYPPSFPYMASTLQLSYDTAAYFQIAFAPSTQVPVPDTTIHYTNLAQHGQVPTEYWPGRGHLMEGLHL